MCIRDSCCIEQPIAALLCGAERAPDCITPARKVLLAALGIINHLPVIGTLNAALGCVVGILQGLLIVWILGVLISGVLNLNSDGWWIFTQEAVGRTHIFHYFLTPELLARFQ